MGYRTNDFEVFMIYKPDKESMLNALRVVLEIKKEQSISSNKDKKTVKSTTGKIIE